MGKPKRVKEEENDGGVEEKKDVGMVLDAENKNAKKEDRMVVMRIIPKAKKIKRKKLSLRRERKKDVLMVNDEDRNTKEKKKKE